MAADIWIATILKLGFIVAVVHLALSRIIPMLQDFFSTAIKDKKALESLTSLIGILILILAGKEALTVVEELNNAVLNYILTFGPALLVLSNLIYYLQWVILAVFLVAVLRSFRK